MTKKHYEAIAGSLNHYITSKPPVTTNAIERECVARGVHYAVGIANDLADYFATDNPKFNRARFLQACGVQRYAGSKQEMEDNSFIDDVLKSQT